MTFHLTGNSDFTCGMDDESVEKARTMLRRGGVFTVTTADTGVEATIAMSHVTMITVK